MIGRLVRFLFWVVLTIVYLIAIVWAAGALFFDLPVPSIRSLAAIVWLTGAVVLPIFLRKHRLGLLLGVAGFVSILTWWLTIQPRKDRDWKREVAVLAHADIDGNRVTIHDI